MLKKDPKERITAKEALAHSWFNQEENEINNEKLEFAEHIDEE